MDFFYRIRFIYVYEFSGAEKCKHNKRLKFRSI